MSISDKFFISPTLHERLVKLPDGSEHKLHFKELPASEFRRFRNAEQSEDEEKQVGSMAMLIAASLCEPNGKPALSYTKAQQLTAAAANALVAVVLEVNGFSGKKDSPSVEQTGSDTSSA
jgi:hypothetical protein